MDMTTGMAHPKGKTRKQQKSRADRMEAAVLSATYEHCAVRDDGCAVMTRLPIEAAAMLVLRFGRCAGRLELAHLYGHRQSKHMHSEPEVKHDSRHTLMLCARHHYCEERRGLRFVAVDPALGMDGEINWLVMPPKDMP